MTLVRYSWDFYGPRSEGTAQHFRKHLEQFLVEHALVGCETGLSSAGDGHAAAHCTAPPEARALIESALRPKRTEKVEAENAAG